MDKQNQVKQTLSKPENIEYVRQLAEGDEIGTRSKLIAHICQQFAFHDPRGRSQIAGCSKALRELEDANHFTLPPARNHPGIHPPRRLPQPLPIPKEVPSQAGEVEGLELVRVCTTEHMQIWNELMITEHPQGERPLVGRQLRYLIGSQYGWLGGFGFAAAALKLADRDKWIGWDATLRGNHLDLVVGMSRFLIRPSVKSRNLASMVLAMSMAALPDDFEHAYGYKPLLVESFVDLSRYRGTCYQAANWIEVGKTKGRGRQDSLNQCRLSPKAIYVYPLKKDFRKRMGLSPNAGQGPLRPEDGLESEDWAEYEFGGAPLKDARLSERLVKVAAEKAEAPGRSYSGVAKGDWAATRAYYRMIDQPEESEVSMANILAPHRERTIRRMMGQKTVLCIQDGSDLDYNNLSKCEGLGVIGTNQTQAESRGLHMHTTFAVASNGLSLGVLTADCTAPEIKSSEDDRPKHTIPIEEKKTFVWLQHHRALVNIASQMPQTRLLDVCDREADFFELFDEQRQNPCVDLLIRAQHDRKLIGHSLKLFDAIRQEPIKGQTRLLITRKSARPKRSKQKASPKRPGRTADMEIRYMRTQLPGGKKHPGKEPIDNIWVVHAVETNPPADTKPVEWFLLTTLEITSVEDAEQCLRWYALRWRIEDWHRVLKSGCRIEDLAHVTAERLRRAIAINMVIAWRIMLMVHLSREVPELPAEVVFSDIELRTLKAYAKKKKLKPPLLLSEAVGLIAKIGGYLGRKHDPPPGHQIIWQGYREFQFMCLGYSLLEPG